jgi:hypothetical protein
VGWVSAIPARVLDPTFFVLLITAIAGSLSPRTCSPATLRVSKLPSAPFGSIQEAIDASSNGDTVLVAAGTYYEHIDFKGRAIVVEGAGAAFTTIDGSHSYGSCVVFRSGEARSSVLKGFTITGGTGTGPPPPACCRHGGGIYILDAEPSVVNNVITGNAASTQSSYGKAGWGGGIFIRGAIAEISPLIADCVITRNIAGDNGGGIAAQSYAFPEILRNVISQNEAGEDDAGDGGGIWILGTADGTVISGNRIESNTAGDHGGGLYFGAFWPVHLVIHGNIIALNVAEQRAGSIGDSGGGIWLYHSNAQLQSNTIVLNAGLGDDSTWGGGILLRGPGHPFVSQNIIGYSTAGGGIKCLEGTTPTIENNLVWANSGGDANGECPDWVGVDGNVSADPHFCDLSSGEFSLAEDSPALTHPSGVVGAVAAPGCTGTAVLATTWGRIKALYRGQSGQ